MDKTHFPAMKGDGGLRSTTVHSASLFEKEQYKLIIL